MTFNKSKKQRNKLAVSQNLFYSQSIKIGWNTLQESQCKDSIRWPSSQVFKAWRNSHPRCCWGYLLVITHCCLCSWTTASAQLYSFDRHLAHSLGPLWVIKLLQMMDGRASQGHSCRVSRVNTAVQITNVVNFRADNLFDLFQLLPTLETWSRCPPSTSLSSTSWAVTSTPPPPGSCPRTRSAPGPSSWPWLSPSSRVS